MLMRRNTKPTPYSSENIPTADSKTRVMRMRNWMIPGRGSKDEGRGGIPRDIEEREKKTVV
jgi:hypothetical protein